MDFEHIPTRLSALTVKDVEFYSKPTYTQGSVTAGITLSTSSGFIQTYDAAIVTAGSVAFAVSKPTISTSTLVSLTPPINANTGGKATVTLDNVTTGSFTLRVNNGMVGTIGTVKVGYSLF